MNITKIMASLLLLPGIAACTSQSSQEQAGIIERPEVTIENGKFTAEVLSALGKVSSPVVSPDGKTVLYSVTFESVKQNSSNAELWTMGIDGSNPTRITVSPKSELNATWIEGGKKIAFLYPENGKMQIFTMDADGKNRKCVSNVENGIDGFLFSPDESKILFISQVKWAKSVTDQYPDLDKANCHIVDDLMYKHWDEWVKTIPHPFIADFNGETLTNAIDIMENEPYESPMKPFGGIESFTWAPDSKSVVYVSRKKTGLEYSISTNSDLYCYDLNTKETKNLTEGMMGYDTNPIFSKSGSHIAWLSMEHDGYESDKNRIFILDLNSGKKTDLTANWDYAASAIAWSTDEKSILFTAPYQGTIPMFKVDVATQKIDTIASGQYDYDAIVPVDGNTILTLRHSMNEPNEIYAIAQNGSINQLTEVNDGIPSQLTPIKIEKRLIPTTDGKEMTTWVLFPPEFDPAKKYPAILYCQGGPQSPVSQFWSSRWNLRLMASMGYIVIAPNRRGLPGFGTEWNAQISGDYGGQNMKDYLSAVDYMKKEPYVDGEHIGAVGASYGGFSIYWLAGHHDHRFAALIAHAGIFNMEAQYLETEEMWFANWDMGGAPWEKNNKIAQGTFATSPHKFIQNWDTPILVTVGEKDYRILASQGMMAFNAAKLRGIPTRMLVFPDENHWILKPQNAMLWQREFFNWLDRWLKPDSEAAKANAQN